MTFAGASTSVFGALPVRVKELVAGAPISQGGVDGETGLCWLISGARLLVWKLDWSVHAHTTVLSGSPSIPVEH